MNSSEAALPELVETAFNMVTGVRQRYGMARFELGLLLETIQDQQLWVGKAESFWQYVDSLRLNRNACRSYMKVAKKFITELKVSDALLTQIAACNFSVLEKAANIVTPENAADVIAAVLALHQRDALCVLSELDPGAKNTPDSDDVSKLFGRYMQLTDDARIEFIHRVQYRPGQRRSNRPSESSTPAT